MYRFSLFCSTHPFATAMAGGGLILFGLVAIPRLPLALFPSTAYPGLTVETEYFGVGPEKIEEILTKPIEESLTQVGGIKRMFSSSEEGKSTVHLEFEKGASLNVKSVETRERVDLVAAGFPRETQKPAILRYDPQQKPVLMVSLDASGRSLDELREIADFEIKKAIERVPGAGEVIVAGGRVREIEVDFDRPILESRGVSANEVASALQKQNISLAIGPIPAHGGRFQAYVRGRLASVSEIAGLVVHADESGRKIRISDLGTVSYAYREKDSSARTNGEEKVSLFVQRAGDSDLLALSDGAIRELEGFRARGIEHRILYDQSATIRRMLRNVALAGAAGFLLTFLAGWRLHGRLRAAVLVGIPMSAMVVACFPLFLSGTGFDLISLTGLLAGAGCSILLIHMHIRASERGGLAASARAGMESFIALLLLAAVFLPILFSAPDIRATYGGLAFCLLLVICISIFFSMGVAGFIQMKRDVPAYENPLPDRAERLAEWFAFDRSNARPGSRRIKTLVIRHRAVLIYVAVLLAGIAAYWLAPKTFLGSFESNEIIATVEFPSGTSFATSDGVTRKVEGILSQTEGVREVSSRIQPGQGTLTLKLKDGVVPSNEYIEMLKTRVQGISEAFVYFQADEGGGDAGEITIDVFGDRVEVMDSIVRDLAKKGGALPGITDVVLRYKNPRPELRILVDREKAEGTGISISSIGQAVRYAIQGGVATKFLERRREIDVRLRFKDVYRDDPEDLRMLSVKGMGGQHIPLVELSTFANGTSPVKIFRKNKKRVLSFTLRYAGAGLGAWKDELDHLLESLVLPEGYRVAYGDDMENLLESRSRLAWTVVLAALFAYMVMAATTESLRSPVLLLLALPLPVSVSVIALQVFQIPVSLPVFTGLILSAALSLFLALHFLDIMQMQARGNQWTIIDLRLVVRYGLRLVLPVVAFYIPLSLIFGEGGQILRGVALTALISFPVTALFSVAVFVRFAAEVPFIAGLLKEHSSTLISVTQGEDSDGLIVEEKQEEHRKKKSAKR